MFGHAAQTEKCKNESLRKLRQKREEKDWDIQWLKYAWRQEEGRVEEERRQHISRPTI
jgi:hypothetical protein